MIPDVLSWAIQGGPVAIFAVMWWLERQDRKAQQDKLDVTVQRMFTLAQEQKDANNRLAFVLGVRDDGQRAGPHAG